MTFVWSNASSVNESFQVPNIHFTSRTNYLIFISHLSIHLPARISLWINWAAIKRNSSLWMLTRDKEMIDMQDGDPRCCDYLRGCQGRWTLVRWNLMGFLMNGSIEF
ncbi:hypothetical protein YC2023_028761 [Brassica napus]